MAVKRARPKPRRIGKLKPSFKVEGAQPSARAMERANANASFKRGAGAKAKRVKKHRPATMGEAPAPKTAAARPRSGGSGTTARIGPRSRGSGATASVTSSKINARPRSAGSASRPPASSRLGNKKGSGAGAARPNLGVVGLKVTSSAPTANPAITAPHKTGGDGPRKVPGHPMSGSTPNPKLVGAHPSARAIERASPNASFKRGSGVGATPPSTVSPTTGPKKVGKPTRPGKPGSITNPGVHPPAGANKMGSGATASMPKFKARAKGMKIRGGSY